MTKISMKSRQEIIQRYFAKYKKSSKKEKGKILDSVCPATEFSRDRAKNYFLDVLKEPLRQAQKNVDGSLNTTTVSE